MLVFSGSSLHLRSQATFVTKNSIEKQSLLNLLTIITFCTNCLFFSFILASTVVGDVNVTATATNQLTGATKVLGGKKFEYTIDIPNLVNIIALARGLNQFEAFEWLDSLLRENGVVLGNDREVQHLDTLNVEKQGKCKGQRRK